MTIALPWELPHEDGILQLSLERLRARLVTAMMSLETQRKVELPHFLRERFESYLKRTGQAQS